MALKPIDDSAAAWGLALLLAGLVCWAGLGPWPILLGSLICFVLAASRAASR